MVSCVEKNRVGSLRSHSVQLEQLFPKLGSRPGKEFVQRTLVLLIEECDESLEPPCLLPKIPGGANQPFQPRKTDLPDAFNAQKAGGAQVCQCSLHIGPGRVLRQVCPGNHLEPGLRRPPMLWSPGRIQLTVVLANVVLFGCRRQAEPLA